MPETSRKKSVNAVRLELREGRPTIAAVRPIPDEAEPAEPDFQVTVGREVFEEIIRDRQVALIRIHSTLDQVAKDLSEYFPDVPEVLPPQIQGRLVNPDGTPVRIVSVEVEEPDYASDEVDGSPIIVTWPKPRSITDDRGVFSITLPTVPVPQSGLRLRVRGGNGATEVVLRRVDVLEGKLGVLDLDRSLTPLPRSIVARLRDIVPTSDEDVQENPEDFAEPAPQIMLGEGDCARFFHSNSGVIDRYSYSMLIRLIEPQVSPKQLVIRTVQADGKYTPVGFAASPVREFSPTRGVDIKIDLVDIVDVIDGLGHLRFVERVPVDRPIDVAEFHNRVEVHPTYVPKAASLGLGYVVKMRQVWIPAGLSLGNLLYSLALAPGEQQRIAVFEQVETLTVRETEGLSVDEVQRFREAADTSTLAIFDSSYREAVSGGSSMHTESQSWGIGGAGGIAGFVSGLLFGVGVAGGYGSSSSSGSTSSWQKASRDFVSSASQDFHSRLSREAVARRRSSRTGVRLATAADREQVTTKVIANHNHCHALTIQHWEVLRHYAVTSRVEDVQLVCFVPLEIIQFLPRGQGRTLHTGNYTRDQLLRRYTMLIRYHDVLAYHLQRRPDYIYGLTLLRNFAANPTMAVQSSSGLAQEVISFSVTGTFLPFEEVFVSLVTKSGGRVGPVKLIGPSESVPPDTFSSAEELLQYLRERRTADAGEPRSATLVLPDHIARTDVARFELSRRFSTFSYKLKFDSPLDLFTGLELAASDLFELQNLRQVTIRPSQLEQLLGGPYVWDVQAVIQGGDTYADAFGDRSAAQRMGTTLPIPALRVPPVLSFADLLRIESVFQHVVHNTVTYSKAIWVALTPEERAILLERFTIGVPDGGVPDASQEVPLLNCVANEVLGYFGNAMIMPFHIPPHLADPERMGVTSRDVQEALLKFHRQAFVPPRSSITLPTRGMLAEAVLGACNACEKIDLTRFWNWQDSPAEEAAELKPSDIEGQSLIGPQGVEAPGKLVPTSPINLLNISTGEKAPAPSSDLLAELIKKMPQPTKFEDITGLAKLQAQLQETLKSASEARKESVTAAKDLAQKAMTELPNVMRAAAQVEGKEEQEKAEKEKKEAEQKAKALKEGLDKLSSNAASYIGLAGAQTGDPEALGMAKSIVSSLFGADLPPLADLGALYAKFKPAEGEDDATKRGKKAFLEALGLSQAS